MSLDDALKAALDERRHNDLYRQRKTVSSAQQVELMVGKTPVLSFCSNNYLGLANHPAVLESFQRASRDYGVGSGASHLINGHSERHEALEAALADFTGYPRALLFSTGYMANLGTISTLVGRGDGVFEDRLNHASLLDGGLASGAKFSRFHHASSSSLETKLSNNAQCRRKLVVTDGVFSMDGDIAPLKALSDVCQRHDAWLMVDDAHGIGCVADGRGSGAYHHLSPEDIPIYMGTLGKALGSFGAFIAGSEILIESLIQFARPYIYTTALPPAVAAASLTSLNLIREEPWRQTTLKRRIQAFKAGCKRLGLTLMPSDTPIQPLLLGSESRAMQVSQRLMERGLWVSPIRYPTVPKGQARLRVTLTAEHTESHVDALLEGLAASVDN